MRYFLSPDMAMKRLETPSVYAIKTDELYELDEAAFSFLKSCMGPEGSSSDDKDFIEYCMKEGILTTEPIIMYRPPVRQSPIPSLRYLELQITDQCNLRCRHCYIGDISSDELSEEQIKNILREFEAVQGLRIMITGGEPLMHSRFQDINSMLPEFFFHKVLFSNGILITKELLEDLNVDEIQISIDGLEDAHDALRGKGTFNKAINAVRLCIDRGFPVSISTMVHAKNLNDFDQMDEMFREIGILDWTVDIPCISGRLRENSAFQLTPEEGGRYLRYGFGKGLHGSGEGFGCGLHLMSVMADGKIAKCTFYADKPAGHISDGLEECRERIAPVKLSELQCDCSFIEECRGGCRYRAEASGTPLGKDLYRCALYDIIG